MSDVEVRIFKAGHLPPKKPSYSRGDFGSQTVDTQPMNDITRSEINDTLAAIEERLDRRVERMEASADKRASDYKAELSLRDEQIRRELDLRQD